MLNNSRNSALISALVEYAVQNINSAVDVLNLQKDDFDDDEDFYKEVNENSSIEMDDFVLGLATSEAYLPDLLDILMEKGYEIGDTERDPEKILEDLVLRVGRQRVAAMLIKM